MVGVVVAVLVGVSVMVEVGNTKEVKVGNGVEEGRKTASCVLVNTASIVGNSTVGSCRKVAVAVGRTNTSGSS